MIENKELKIDEGSAVKNVDSGVKVGTDDSTSTPEKKRKKFARFYDWFWFVGLLMQVINSAIWEAKTSSNDDDLIYALLVLSLVVYVFTWMLSKRKGNAFTDFIFTLCYGFVIFISSMVAYDCKLLDTLPILSFIIAFIYWAFLWNFTRKESKN